MPSGGRQVSLGAQPTCPPPLPHRSSPTSAPSSLLQLQCSPLFSATASPPPPPPRRRPTARLSVCAPSPQPCRRPRPRLTAAGSRTASPPSTAPTCCSTRTTRLIGTLGGKRLSRRRAPRTSPSSSRLAIAHAIGVM